MHLTDVTISVHFKEQCFSYIAIVVVFLNVNEAHIQLITGLVVFYAFSLKLLHIPANKL